MQPEFASREQVSHSLEGGQASFSEQQTSYRGSSRSSGSSSQLRRPGSACSSRASGQTPSVRWDGTLSKSLDSWQTKSGRGVNRTFTEEKEVILRLEYMTQTELKVALAGILAISLIGLGALLWLFIIKTAKEPNVLLRNKTYFIISIVDGSCQLVGVCFIVASYAWVLHQARAKGYVWTARRWRLSKLYMVELGVSGCITVLYVGASSYLIMEPCAYLTPTVQYFGMFRWPMLATLLTIHIIQTSMLSPYPTWLRTTPMPANTKPPPRWKRLLSRMFPRGNYLLVIDAPFWYHWPKAIPWLIASVGAIIGYTAGLISGFDPVPDDESQCYGHVECPVSSSAFIANLSVTGAFLIFIGCYLGNLLVVYRRLRSVPYVKYRTANLSFRVQVRSRLYAVVVGFLSAVLLWLSGVAIKSHSCYRFIFSNVGMLPLDFTNGVFVLCVAWYHLPLLPRPGAILETELKEFDWIDYDDAPPTRVPTINETGPTTPPTLVPTHAPLRFDSHKCGMEVIPSGGVDVREMPSMPDLPPPVAALEQVSTTESSAATLATDVGGLSQPSVGHAPLGVLRDDVTSDVSAPAASPSSPYPLRGRAQHEVFCVETALKLMYWSELVYDYQQVSDTKLNMETALALYGLGQYHVVWDQHLERKALIGWGGGNIVLAFRGTDSIKNVKKDLQGWRVEHPPTRGSALLSTRPLVHSGFLTLWTKNDFKESILDVVRRAVDEQALVGHRNVHIYVTGHSLGGALACLASWDIHNMTKDMGGAVVSCYTYGCPRIGNHAFCRDMDSSVPDTWHVINDQDIVTREFKGIALYKRHGQRVIINAIGDIIVRPTWLEIQTHRLLGAPSVSQHQLGSYARSFNTILSAQFGSSKSLPGGKTAVIHMGQQPALRLLLEQHIGLEFNSVKRYLLRAQRTDGLTVVPSFDSVDEEGGRWSQADQAALAARRISV